MTSRKAEKVLNTELKRLKKGIEMLNPGTDILDHILALEKTSNSHIGLGYIGESLDVEKATSIRNTGTDTEKKRRDAGTLRRTSK